MHIPDGFLDAKTAVAMVLAFVAVSSAFAGRPLTVDDAEPVAPEQFELEIGLDYVSDHGTDHFDFPLALTIGFTWDFCFLKSRNKGE